MKTCKCSPQRWQWHVTFQLQASSYFPHIIYQRRLHMLQISLGAYVLTINGTKYSGMRTEQCTHEVKPHSTDTIKVINTSEHRYIISSHWLVNRRYHCLSRFLALWHCFSAIHKVAMLNAFYVIYFLLPFIHFVSLYIAIVLLDLRKPQNDLLHAPLTLCSHLIPQNVAINKTDGFPCFYD